MQDIDTFAATFTPIGFSISFEPPIISGGVSDLFVARITRASKMWVYKRYAQKLNRRGGVRKISWRRLNRFQRAEAIKNFIGQK